MRTNADKKKFLQALEETALVYTAAKRVGIDKATIYRWRKRSPRFAEQMDAMLERGRSNKIDFAEGKLFLMIQNSNFPATKFYLENNHPKYVKPRRENDPMELEYVRTTERLKLLLEEVARRDEEQDKEKARGAT